MEQTYTLICGRCRGIFESNEGFPKSQLCPKCHAEDKKNFLLSEVWVIESQVYKLKHSIHHPNEAETRESADRVYEAAKRIHKKVFGERPPSP